MIFKVHIINNDDMFSAMIIEDLGYCDKLGKMLFLVTGGPDTFVKYRIGLAEHSGEINTFIEQKIAFSNVIPKKAAQRRIERFEKAGIMGKIIPSDIFSKHRRPGAVIKANTKNRTVFKDEHIPNIEFYRNQKSCTILVMSTILNKRLVLEVKLDTNEVNYVVYKDKKTLASTRSLAVAIDMYNNIKAGTK